MEPLTVIHLVDGKLRSQCNIDDYTTLVVKGTIDQSNYAAFQSRLYAKYKIFGDRINADKEARSILDDMGIEVLDVIIRKTDYSG